MKTVYFILNDREFGRARFKGEDKIAQEWKEKFFVYPKWCTVTWLRYVLHPIIHCFVVRK